jgi:hypothetical protein
MRAILESEYLISYAWLPRIFVVVVADELLYFSLLVSDWLEPAEQHEDFFTTGGAVNMSIDVGLNIVCDALSWINNRVPQKLWLQVATI